MVYSQARTPSRPDPPSSDISPPHNTNCPMFAWLWPQRSFSGVNCIKRSGRAGQIPTQVSTSTPYSPCINTDICLLCVFALTGVRRDVRPLHRHSHARLSCPRLSCCFVTFECVVRAFYCEVQF